MDKERNLTANINKYYLFQFFADLMFFSPIIILFWQSNGLTMSQIMILQSIYSLGVIVLELPTGAFADYFGKRTSIIFGTLLWTLGFFWYGSSHLFWQFVLGELIVGVGSAFISGADRAYIHEFLKSNNKENEYRKVEGKARSFMQIAQGLGSLLGGFIGSLSFGLTIIASGFSSFLGLLFALRFSKTKNILPREEKTEYWKIIKESIVIVKNHRQLLWLTIFFACFNALMWPLNLYSQLYLKMLGVPVFFFGIIFTLFNFISAFGSALTHQFEKITKNNPFLVMSMIAVSSLFVLGIFPSVFLIPLWSIYITFFFMNHTIISVRVLKIIPSGKAATILSFQSLLRRLIYAVIGPLLGMTSDTFGLPITLISYSLFLFLIFGLLLSIKKNFD